MKFDAIVGNPPKDWNEKMLNDEHYKVVKYWVNSFNAFPTVDIKGGVAVTYWDKNKTFGKIGTFVAFDEFYFEESKRKRLQAVFGFGLSRK